MLRTEMMWREGLVLAGLVLMASCTPTADPAGTAAPPTQALVLSTSTPTSIPVTPTSTREPLPDPAAMATVAVVLGVAPGAVPPGLPLLVSTVREDLAGVLDVPVNVISLEQLRAVNWDTEVLGCDGAVEAADSLAAQADGYQIALIYQGERFVYRAELQGDYVACPADVESFSTGPESLDPVIDALVELASRNLAERLDIPQRRVFLVDVSTMEWPDNSLGCRLAEQEYVPTPVYGYRITLRAGRQEYFYHSTDRRVVFCPAEAEWLPGTPGATPAATETVTTSE